MQKSFWERLRKEAERKLSPEAFEIADELIDQVDSETTIRDLLWVLEDGEALREMNWNDIEPVEEAYGFFEEYL